MALFTPPPERTRSLEFQLALGLTRDEGRTYGLDWSPDGRYLSYNTDVGGNADVYVYDTESGEHTRLTTHPAEDHLPRWSPDGRFLVFTSDRTGAERIYRMDVDGGGLEMIRTDRGAGMRAR